MTFLDLLSENNKLMFTFISKRSSVEAYFKRVSSQISLPLGSSLLVDIVIEKLSEPGENLE